MSNEAAKDSVVLDDERTQTLAEPGPASRPDSVGALDGERFPPGALLGDRYRIVGLLGRGGMGEVYRAEDLKLGTTVALKFLPAELSLDGPALARFHREVRVARDITHRNVCRVFDIGEVGGLHFLSMEYIDGEDLGALLSRIGRLPREKALELARQICAGLAAAHEVGVLHRDMKPANVMIDGKGRAKITDFGLADLGDELKQQTAFAGTPAYMAPEQLSSGRVSIQTDLYALGLVLYEMFTGERAFDEEDWRERLARSRSADRTTTAQPPPSRPSTHVPGLDPAIETVILRCLEEDPGLRPTSAVEVAARLPGGDPLAAALAAGETPSPATVAAAHRAGHLEPRLAFGLLAAIGLLVGLGLWARQEVSATTAADLPKSSAVLEDRARTLLANLGRADPSVDRAWGWRFNVATADALRQAEPAARQHFWGPTPGRPALYSFWYRESPAPLRPWVQGRWHPSLGDPPPTVPGMTTVVLDPAGHLLQLRVVPASGGTEGEAGRDPPWEPLLEAAGLEAAELTPTESRWIPPFYADGRVAWEGRLSGAGGTTVLVEAAHHRGRPVAFDVLAPWDRPVQETTLGATHLVVRILLTTILIAGFTAGLWLVRRHLRDGHGDRQGANRLALFMVSTQLLAWLLRGHHFNGVGEIEFFVAAAKKAVFWAGFLWVLYIALEPFLRRLWPQGIIAWSRLLAGDLRDPLVGRDVLIGTLLGSAGAASPFLIGELQRRSGQVALFADPNWPVSLSGLRQTLGVLFDLHLSGSMIIALGGVFLFVLLLRLLHRKWLAATIYGLGWLAIMGGAFDTLLPGLPLLVPILLATLITVATARFGLLTLLAYLLSFFVLMNMPTTTDLSQWHAESTVLAVCFVLGLAGWGAWGAMAGRPLFADPTSSRH